MNQNEQVDMNLIGVDKDVTVHAYYNRDILLNVDYNTQIINSIKKLGYYNFAGGIAQKLRDFKIKKLNILISTSLDIIRERTIDELLNSIEESEDYIIFQSNLENRIGRSHLLMSFVNQIDENILNFYNELTLEELNILGY